MKKIVAANLDKSSLTMPLAAASIVALFVGRKVNLSTVFYGIRTNNYLDVVIDLKIIFLVTGLTLLFLFQDKINQVIRWYGGFMILMISSIAFLDPLIFHRFERFVLLVCTLSGIIFIHKSIPNNISKSLVLCGVFCMPILFDHFLVSDSAASFYLIFICLTIFAVKSKFVYYKIFQYSILLFLFLNTLLAIYQISTGTSFGLGLLGESALNIYAQKGLASELVGPVKFLRGYGLFVHPNIFGFVGVLSFATFRDIFKISDRAKRIGILLSLMMIFLSFSRIAWISLLFLICINLSVISFKKTWKAVWILVTVVATGILFYIRYGLSDVYRFGDMSLFGRVISTTTIKQKILGIGIGGYSSYLRDTFPQLLTWQFEPVHNSILLIIAELGLLPCILIPIILIQLKKMWISK